MLVFSVSTSTAQYEVRSKDFSECADKLKIICQEFKLAQIESKQSEGKVDLADFDKRYRSTLGGTERHENIDYFRANKTRFRKKELQGGDINAKNISFWEFYKKLPNYGNYREIILTIFLMYASSIILWVLEIIFILDMLGITSILKFMHDKAH